MKRVFCKISSPCAKCPYKLGMIQMVANPCPQCKMNGYRFYTQIQKELSKVEKEDE